MPEEYAIALITTGTREEADQLSHALVAGHVAACVTTVPGVISHYRWRNAVETDEELLLIVKTRRDLIPEVSRLVRDLHSYEVPEVIALPVIGGNPDYLRWLGEVTSPAVPGEPT